jgi:hypothetical protein
VGRSSDEVCGSFGRFVGQCKNGNLGAVPRLLVGASGDRARKTKKRTIAADPERAGLPHVLPASGWQVSGAYNLLSEPIGNARSDLSIKLVSPTYTKSVDRDLRECSGMSLD